MHAKAVLPSYVQGLVDGKYTLKQASESTGYSIRQLSNFKKQLKTTGCFSVVSKSRGRTANNCINNHVKQRVISLYNNVEYKGINFKYYRECLELYEEIKISLPTLRKIMKEEGIVSPEAHRVKKEDKVHRTRIRRDNEGDLVQIDGTPYPWFYMSGDRKNYCMQGAIDDATGKITALYITENECLYGYMELLRQMAENKGLPREIYSDRAAIFCVTPRDKKKLTQWEELSGIHDKRTQWQRILSDLNIRQILAWSPQAKGRVERMWQTLQGRLPTWLYKHKAKTVAEANRILHKYIKEFNKKFAVKSRKEDLFWSKAPENFLDIMQCIILRKTFSNGEFSFHSYRMYAEGKACCRNKNISLCISERGIFAKFEGDSKYYPVRLCDDKAILQDDDNLSNVLQDIMKRYLWSYAKEVSA